MKKDTKTAVELAKLLKKLVMKGFGRCTEGYSFGCVVCQANRVVKECGELAGLLRTLDKKESRNNHIT